MADSAQARADLRKRLADDRLLTTLVGQAIRTAVLEHKKDGNPIAAWKDGTVASIPPEDIDLPPVYSPADANVSQEA